MSEDLTTLLTIDASQSFAEVARLQDKIDAQQREWAIVRQQTINEMNNIYRGMSLLISSVRTVARAARITIDPIINSMMALVQSMVSLMISTATAMAASSVGLLAGVSLALAAAAFGIQAAQTAELIATSERAHEMMDNVLSRLDQLERGQTFNIVGRTG